MTQRKVRNPDNSSVTITGYLKNAVDETIRKLKHDSRTIDIVLV